MENKEFWKQWFKFVGILILVFLAWLLLIFICDQLFGKQFEKFKYIHYFILLVVILKVKKKFINNIKK